MYYLKYFFFFKGEIFIESLIDSDVILGIFNLISVVYNKFMFVIVLDVKMVKVFEYKFSII